MAEDLPTIHPGWYIPTQSKGTRLPRPRWVLALGNGFVYYSRGGEKKLECREKTMQRWINKFSAVRNASRAT